MFYSLSPHTAKKPQKLQEQEAKNNKKKHKKLRSREEDTMHKRQDSKATKAYKSHKARLENKKQIPKIIPAKDPKQGGGVGHGHPFRRTERCFDNFDNLNRPKRFECQILNS